MKLFILNLYRRFYDWTHRAPTKSKMSATWCDRNLWRP